MLPAEPIIHTDALHRMAYATDASAYRELPLGVAYPKSDADVVALIHEARRRKTCLIPRAGGTSIAGQVVGNGIVVDVSRHLNKIIEINPQERWARVQPGVVRDELNLALRPYGLFFSPETSTSNRCCIGGMVGNNSCGTHSLVYGSTRHHLLQLKGYLADGSPFDTAVRGTSSIEQAIYRQLEQWQHNPAICQLIADNFPDRALRRRSCGYAIDEALQPSAFTLTVGEGQVANEAVDLCRMICGSEGTLCFITEIRLALDPLPQEPQMVLCAHFHTLEASFEANLTALRHRPLAVELMDGRILELSKDNAAVRGNHFFVEGTPAALLIAEFNGPECHPHVDALEKALLSEGAYACTRVYGSEVAKVWALRKAGLGVLNGMKGDAKPIGVIEDTAVAPERLPAYMKDLRAMMQRLDLDCVYYGHIGTGELHLRPILNIKTEAGRRKFRQVAEATAQIVRQHKGSLSGEHGDGRLRGEFIPLMYGTECYEMMRAVKHCWDPYGVFNTHKVVDAPPMDEGLRYPLASPPEGNDTYFNWRADFDACRVAGTSGVVSQRHALLCSIEQCNGAGDCRRSAQMGGTLCPAYKVANRNELLSTRARANILRELLTYGVPKGTSAQEELKLLQEVLYSCLACKGCKAECPSNVDMTRIRAELLQQLYDRHGTPFRSWMVARMAQVEHIGAAVPWLYNFCATWKPTATLIKQIVGFAPERSIPTLKQQKVLPSTTHQGRKVYLFLDEFTRHQEPELAVAWVALLERLGYRVAIPKHTESGRAAISKGCLRMAQRYAQQNVELLSQIVDEEAVIVGLEPSCILTFRDEYPDLVPPQLRSIAMALSKKALLYDEFVMNEVAQGCICSHHFNATKCHIWLHGHCHQKALVGIEKTAAMLRLIEGATVHVIPSGCCGMAGSFGYEKEHYHTSLAIGETVLFPTVRKAVATAGEATFVVAPGTSCRQQILDGTGVHAVHPIILLERMLRR